MRSESGHRSKSLAVYVNQTLVGILTWFDGDQHQFTVDRSYSWDKGAPYLTLSMKKNDGTMSRAVVSSRQQLPPFFSNLLPEGALRSYLAARAGVKPIREFFLLDALKADLPGALVLQSFDAATPPIHPQSDTLETSGARAPSTALRFSLAGIQLKFSAIVEASGGLTIPAGGVGGSAIVKLPSTRFENVPENEFSMMKMAGELGMNVANVELCPTDSIQNLPENLPEGFGRSLIVSRFDRSGSERIHMEDFAQIFSVYPENKYQGISYGGIAKVLYQETAIANVREFIRRLTFNLLIGNADMHLKNWSLLYQEPQKPVLSPGYDFVPTNAFLPDDKLALSIAGEKDMAKISEEHFARMAAKAGIPTELVVREVRETVADFRANWERFKRTYPVSSDAVVSIEQNNTRLKI